jgi:chemotaxis protein CheX
MALNQSVIEQLGISEAELTRLLASDVCEIFSTMVGVTEIAYLPREIENPTHFSNSVTAMVGLAGTSNGMVCLHTSKALGLWFTAQMLGMEVTEVDDDMDDALGEIANMIGGSFKHHLSNSGDSIKLSTPSVVTGSDYSITSGHPGESLSLVFQAGGEEFIISAIIAMD